MNWPYPGEVISPSDFDKYILNDQGTSPGLKAFLSSRPGFDINSPGTDPTKAIVLCYGVPLRVSGEEKCSSVDSVLTLLFNSNEWGLEPIGRYSQPRITNPYYYNHWAAGSPSPGDFGDFRASSYNNTSVSPSSFTIVRMLDNNNAVAGGVNGLLYTGTYANGTWTWTAVTDENKAFIAYEINDIFVLDSQHAWVASVGYPQPLLGGDLQIAPDQKQGVRGI